MIRSPHLKICALLLGLLISPFACANYYRFYLEGPANVVMDQLGLFGPPTSEERPGFVRTFVQFRIPAPDSLSPDWGFYPVDDGMIRFTLFERSVEVGFNAAWLDEQLPQGDALGIFRSGGTTPGQAWGNSFYFFAQGAEDSGVFPGPLSFPDAVGSGIFQLYDPDDLRTTYVNFRVSSAAGRALPEPPSGYLILAALGLAHSFRRRRTAGNVARSPRSAIDRS